MSALCRHQKKPAGGFEMQFGTNHLEHFLFSGLLIDRLEAADGHIVTLSSIAHFSDEIRFHDLMSEKAYSPMRAQTQNKGANLLFALEIVRKLQVPKTQIRNGPELWGYTMLLPEGWS